MSYNEFTSLSEEEKAALPKLAFLRVELHRQIGLSDFIIRVSTPTAERDGAATSIAIRGTPAMAKMDTTIKLAKLIGREMHSREDKTFKWSALDIQHLAKMLNPIIKMFCSSSRIELVQFATDALSE